MARPKKVETEEEKLKKVDEKAAIKKRQFFRMAKAQAARDMFKELEEIFENYQGDVESHPLFLVYREIDKIGYQGVPVLQAGLPSYGFDNVILKISSQNGHAVSTTMGNLIRTISKAAFKVAGELKSERFQRGPED